MPEGATMTQLRFGTGTTVRDFTEYRKWLQTAEGIGFDMLTCGDSQSLWAECFTLMTFAAVHTTRPDLAITVSNPCTRHPAVAASACASVQQISEGRFRFGMSSGDSALRNIGVQPGSVELMERYMRAIQAMTAGETFDWDGHPVGLHWLPQPTPVPVWIAAEGPRTQRMAGRYADGVVLSNCLTPERLAVAMEHLSAGAAEVGRSVDDIEIWHMCNLIFAKSEDEGINQIRSVLAGTANHVFRFTLEGKGSARRIERARARSDERIPVALSRAPGCGQSERSAARQIRPARLSRPAGHHRRPTRAVHRAVARSCGIRRARTSSSASSSPTSTSG